MFKSSNKVKVRGYTGTCIIMYLNTNTKLSISRYIAMIDNTVGAWKNKTKHKCDLYGNHCNNEKILHISSEFHHNNEMKIQ